MASNDRRTRACRPGFTMVELIIVVALGMVLTGMAVAGVGGHMKRQGAKNARDTLVHAAVRARSAAIERGGVVRLQVDPATDRAWVVAGRSGAGDTLQVVDYTSEHVDVLVPGNATLTVCYSPRGYALGSPCTTLAAEVVVSFALGSEVSRATVWPLGQVMVN